MEANKRPRVDDARLTQYTLSLDYPPPDVGEDAAACAEWYQHKFSTVRPPHADPSMTDREMQLYALSAEQYIEMRRSGAVSCEEYACALVKRARYHRRLNAWIYTSYDRFEKLIESARALDARATELGIDAIMPLCGLPIPMKGTAAVVDYPSGSGSGVLSGYTPLCNSELTEKIIGAHGLIFGCTNVPEFAASYTTANPASGTTANPFDRRFTVGGSSGGAASAVAAHLCPLAVSEDTGGSTRLPAACTQLYGFDPARNHYPNSGNPGMSLCNDQLGLVARSLNDIILYDAALLNTSTLHETWQRNVAARTATDIKVGAPIVPFVETRLSDGLCDTVGYNGLSLQPALREKLDLAKAAMRAAGFVVVEQEWPSRHFDHLEREENVCVEALFGGRPVNGKPLDMFGQMPHFLTFTGQMATFIASYLGARVSVREVVDDMGRAGAMHNTGFFHRRALSDEYDETQLRYLFGPKIAIDVEAYNSYFDVHGVDLLVLPVTRVAAPNLADLAGYTVAIPRIDGSSTNGSVMEAFNLHLFAFKHLHIPKLVVPTGLTTDGRPTAVQLWGRAVAYDDMYDDGKAVEHSIRFLQLARRVVESMLATTPQLARVDAPSPFGIQ